MDLDALHGDDPIYRARRDAIAGMAMGSDRPPATVEYLDTEHQTWTTARRALTERWRQVAAPELLVASANLDLPTDRVPQLDEVSARLQPHGGFEFRAVPGLVPVAEFFGALANGRFLSTQYLRHHRSPLYTPEPDLIHEVLGHGTALANPELALLHRAAGAAMLRMETAAARRFVADVFWFSAEFGVIADNTGRGLPLAYGAGLLSSMGELDSFQSNAEIRPLDIAAMGTLPYEIDQYQPVLFAGRSLTEVLDVVGGFFDTATDDGIAGIADGNTTVAA